MSDPLLLLAMAVAPGLAIAIFINRKDQYEAEPKKLMIVSFVLGMVAIFPAMLVEEIGMSWLPPYHNVSSTFFLAFLVVGCTEELVKFLMLRFYAYRQHDFNEPFDGILYAVMVGMGFATLENIFYVNQYGFGNALLRMFTAVPAHASFAVIMGYYVGLAKFSKQPLALQLQGLFFAIFMHGAYDFFLMLHNVPLMAGGALVSLYFGIRFSLKAIRFHQQNSPFNPLRQSPSSPEEDTR